MPPPIPFFIPTAFPVFRAFHDFRGSFINHTDLKTVLSETVLALSSAVLVIDDELRFESRGGTKVTGHTIGFRGEFRFKL